MNVCGNYLKKIHDTYSSEIVDKKLKKPTIFTRKMLLNFRNVEKCMLGNIFTNTHIRQIFKQKVPIHGFWLGRFGKIFLRNPEFQNSLSGSFDKYSKLYS